MAKKSSTKKAGVDISGGQTSVGRDVAGRDIVYNQAAPEPRLTSLFQIPAPPADFTGRETELRELREAILKGGVHISGLQGQGGVGKTALALKLAAEIADRFPDAQIHLDLKGASEKPLTAAEALAHVVRSFHPEAKLPEKEDELKAQFTSVLHGKRVLLLMDNARDAAQMQPLIPPAGSTLLVTSRVAFTLPGLKPKKLDTLPPKDAKDLLVKIAPRIGSAAEATARACGYLALALRLAATAIAEHADLDPAEYAKKLADESKSLKLLVKAGRDPSMEASIALSYNLLNDEMKKLWRVLGVFPDTFDALAVATVWEVKDEDVAQDELSDMVRFSMLEWDDPAKRYFLHDLMRAFARREANEEERYGSALRHAQHYANLLGACDDFYLKGSESLTIGLALFDLEWGNIQAGHAWAVAHSERDREGALLCRDYPFQGTYILDLRLHPRERIKWMERAIAAARSLGDRAAEGVHFLDLGIAYRMLGDYGPAIECFHQQLSIAREIGNRHGEGVALGNLGNISLLLGDNRRAIEHFGQALAIMRERGDRRGEESALGSLGSAYANLGEYRHAIEYFEQALVIDREIGDRRGEGQDLGNLGIAYRHLGEQGRAIEYYKQALEIAHEIGDAPGEGNAQWNMSLSLADLGDHKQAVAHAETALKILEQIEAPSAGMVRAKLEEWRREG